MPTTIKCPKCSHEFEPTDSIREQIQREVNVKAEEWKRKKEKELEESLRKNIAFDFETKLRLLEQNNKDNEEKLKEARQKEFEFLQKMQELKTKEAEIEITVQKKLQAGREKLSEDLRKIEEQKVAAKETEYNLRIKELEKKNEDTIKLLEEAKRKNEQGSIQLQGEVQELLIQEKLQLTFPFDIIEEVSKGQRGADCVQIIRNHTGQECGKIYYESKRAEKFGGDWIEKLKTDMRRLGTDVGVIITKTLPKEMEKFGLKDGVWICSYADLKEVAFILRESIIKVFNATKNQENRGDKMHLLYDYLTSSEFAEQWKAIREGFLSMKMSIQRERDMMEKLWKSREKQLEKVLLNAAHVRGSIEGISGMNSVDLNLLEEGNEDDMAH